MEEKERAKQQARAQLDSILTMVKRLEHCRECGGEGDCELTDKEVLEGLELACEGDMGASDEERTSYHDQDSAREAIAEDPLDVSVRADWHTPGEESEPDEYRILLCTGGPACQITGSLQEHGEPDTAELQYQDWFTPWERFPTTMEEDEALLEYARQFYFGR